MIRVIRRLYPCAAAGALFVSALSLAGCIDKKLLGGGGGSGGQTGSGGTTTSSGGSGGGGAAGGSGGMTSSGGSGGGGATGGSGGATGSTGGSGGAGGATGGGGPMLDGWARQFGDVYIQEGWGVAADADGNIVITGSMHNQMSMDGIDLATTLVQNPITMNWDYQGQDVFVAKLGPAGNVLWAKSFGNGYPQDGYDVAVDPAGNIILVGGFVGAVDFGGGVLNVPGSNQDLFVVKLDPSGNHLWSKRFGDSATQPQFPGPKVAVDATGAVVVAGSYMGSIDFGGGPLSTGDQYQVDVFVAKLDANGDHVFSHRYGDVEPIGQAGERLRGLDVDSAGNIVFSGPMEGTIDFGGGALQTGGGVFVVKLNPTGGHVWSKVFGKYGADLTALAVTPQDDIVLSGGFSDLIDFGDGMLNEANGPEVFVKLDSAGQLVWVEQYAGSFYAESAAVSPSGDVTFAGYTFAVLDLTALGGEVLTSFDNAPNAVILTVNESGGLVAAKNYSAPSAVNYPTRTLQSIDYDPSGYLITVGSFEGEIDMGFGTLDAGDHTDVLVARLPQSL